jgi:hypothetical protein
MIEFEIGQRVLVEPFKKTGTVRTKSTDPHGTTLYGVVYDGDAVMSMKRKKGAMDVYVTGKRLVNMDSTVVISESTEERDFEELVEGFQDRSHCVVCGHDLLDPAYHNKLVGCKLDESEVTFT